MIYSSGTRHASLGGLPTSTLFAVINEYRFMRAILKYGPCRDVIIFRHLINVVLVVVITPKTELFFVKPLPVSRMRKQKMHCVHAGATL